MRQLRLQEQQYILETNIDDMNPEFYSYVEERIFENAYYKEELIKYKPEYEECNFLTKLYK